MDLPFSDKDLKLVEQGDLKVLLKLDDRGLIPGEKEEIVDYVKRLKEFEEALLKMHGDLAKDGIVEFDELKFPKDELIGKSFYKEPSKVDRDLYDFEIDWVPGFFVTPKFGLLFGGCAFMFEPEFFTLFIIRNSFKAKVKWFIYSRNELISHELSHVARFAMNSEKYEEHFAYQTSTSSFRKVAGSAFRNEKETFLLLFLCFGMLGLQVAQLFLQNRFDFSVWYRQPSNYFMAGMFLYIFYIVLRQRKMIKGFNGLLNRVSEFSSNARALVFRLSDNEVDELVKEADLNAEKVLAVVQSPLRQQIIKEKYL